MSEDESPIKWMEDVKPSNYDAAREYLSLKCTPTQADIIVHLLKNAELTHRRPNDILRACGRSPLPLHDPGVRRNLLKIIKGKELSPILVVSFTPLDADFADGYHRTSVAYHIDPFCEMPLKIANLKKTS